MREATEEYALRRRSLLSALASITVGLVVGCGKLADDDVLTTEDGQPLTAEDGELLYA